MAGGFQQGGLALFLARRRDGDRIDLQAFPFGGVIVFRAEFHGIAGDAVIILGRKAQIEFSGGRGVGHSQKTDAGRIVGNGGQRPVFPCAWRGEAQGGIPGDLQTRFPDTRADFRAGRPGDITIAAQGEMRRAAAAGNAGDEGGAGGDFCGAVALGEENRRAAGIGRRIDPGIDRQGLAPGQDERWTEGLAETVAGGRSGNEPGRRQEKRDDTAQGPAIGIGPGGMRTAGTRIGQAGRHAGLVFLPDAKGQRIAFHRRIGQGFMRAGFDAAVDFNPARRVIRCRPGKARDTPAGLPDGQAQEGGGCQGAPWVTELVPQAEKGEDRKQAQPGQTRPEHGNRAFPDEGKPRRGERTETHGKSLARPHD